MVRAEIEVLCGLELTYERSDTCLINRENLVPGRGFEPS